MYQTELNFIFVLCKMKRSRYTSTFSRESDSFAWQKTVESRRLVYSTCKCFAAQTNCRHNFNISDSAMVFCGMLRPRQRYQCCCLCVVSFPVPHCVFVSCWTCGGSYSCWVVRLLGKIFPNPSEQSTPKFLLTNNKKYLFFWLPDKR